jgi:hypothetical protein
MTTAIDDFPCIGVSRMRAAGDIRPDDKTTTIQFPDDPTTFTVPLHHMRFPNGGGWSFFQCPCGRRARTIRLYDNALACHGYLKELGFRNRVQLIPAHKRAAYHLPRLIARLTGPPARLHPRPGRMLDRRPRLERSLRRSLIVERQFAIDEHDEMLKP